MLRKLVDEKVSLHFRRSDHVKGLNKQEEKVFDRFLARMKELGALLPEQAQGPGCYRFQSPIHRLYFLMQSRAQAEEN